MRTLLLHQATVGILLLSALWMPYVDSRLVYRQGISLVDVYITKEMMGISNMCICRNYCFVWPNCTAVSIVSNAAGGRTCYFSDSMKIDHMFLSTGDDIHSFFLKSFGIPQPTIGGSSGASGGAFQSSTAFQVCSDTVNMNCIGIKGPSTYWNANMACSGGSAFAAADQAEYDELKIFLQEFGASGTAEYDAVLVDIYNFDWSTGWTPETIDWINGVVPDMNNNCATVSFSGDVKLVGVNCGMEYPVMCRM